jgi:ribosomal protein S18 acetylase RimI-like enzyme
MSFVYKKISEDMLDEIIELFIETFNSEPWSDNWTTKTASKRLSPMTHTDVFFGLAAYQENKMCGFVMGVFEQYCDEIEFSIKEFAVKNTGRGQGLGSQLFGEFEKELMKMGVKKITLLTLKGNLTEHFYEKNGFQTSNEITFMDKTI